MMDIRLITLIPPAPAVAQPSAPASISNQGAAIIPQLPIGSILSGFIVNRDPAGNPILRTEQGDVVFSSNFFLKIGSEVVIRIQQSGGHPSAHIVTVNGQPPEIATQQSAFADEPDIIMGHQSANTSGSQTAATNVSTTASNLSGSPLKLGQIIPAILVTPQFVPSPTSANAAPLLLPGSGLQLSVVSLQPSYPATSQPSPLTQLAAAPATSATAPAALSALLPNLPLHAAPQNAPVLPANLQAAQPAPNDATAAIASNQQAAAAEFSGPLGHDLTVQLLTRGADGRSLLYTPLGVVETAELPGMQPGQQLILRVASITQPNAQTIARANAATPLPAAPITELARQWTSLQQILDVLGNEVSSALLPTFPLLPQTTAELPAQISTSMQRMLQFFAALKGESLRDWLGPRAVKHLEEKGYNALLHQVESEFVALAKQFTEPPPHQWQSLFFPINVGGEIQQVRAFIKREKKNTPQQPDSHDEDTRFIVEMELSQLGEMQMDGLVKRREEKLQFDLIIRSHASLPSYMQQEIRTIYTSTSEATGYRGQILFQEMQQFPLNPLEDIVPHLPDNLLV